MALRVSIIWLVFFIAACNGTWAQEDPAVAGASKEVVPLIFPVMGPLTERMIDSFGDPRSGGRQHHGQDLMARKMTPLLAVFDGTVSFRRTNTPNAQNSLYLTGDNGYNASYLHINNDTPGSDNDGLGSLEYAFAPNLQSGMHVVAGQFLGWVGNSGNAESVGPHLHFELERDGVLINAFESLKRAQHITTPRYLLPAPTVLPETGEVRMDAVVRTVDAERQVLAVWAVAYQAASGKQTVVTKPTQKWLRVPPTTALARRDDPATAVTLSELRPGDAVSVFLPNEEVATLTPRRILTEPLPRSTPMVAINRPVAESSSRRVEVATPSAAPVVEASPSPVIAKAPPVLLAPPTEIADRLCAHLNFYRTQRGLGNVVRESRLDHAAQTYADKAALRGGSDRPELRQGECARLLQETGYKAVEWYVSGTPRGSTPEKAIESLRYQRADQIGLFHPAVTELGVGYAERSLPTGGVERYWVVLLTAPVGNVRSNTP